MRTRLASGVVLLVALAVAPAAPAQKGVVGLGADPYSGVASNDGRWRYVTVPLGETTVVERIEVGTGRIERLHTLSSDATVPAVAYDSTPGGLSFDGRTLVLPQRAWRFPQRSSRMNVLDAKSLKPGRPVKLDGTWTFDALSPNGRWMYLIEYTSPRDLTEYAVRAYDLRKHQLVREPVIDPDEPGEDMYGRPVTRETSVDGRWEYTLYEPSEAEHPPFIHALDTAHRTAVCVDLDSLLGFQQLSRLELGQSADGSTLQLTDRGEPVLNVDLESFDVSNPALAAPASEAVTGGDGEDGGGIPVALVIGAGTMLAAGCALLMARRRKAAAA